MTTTMSDLPRQALEIMLRDIRELGADRREPCGVHDRPQWTCAFCLCNVLAPLEAYALGLSAGVPPPQEQIEKDAQIVESFKATWLTGPNVRGRSEIAGLYDEVAEAIRNQLPPVEGTPAPLPERQHE